ncbi:MAG: hypothetical protein EPO06_08010 [Burkholderiaceae bacterium]|nr:MAG: hypothetical protein EPO06_08010 [Burkholderiaceae bacterium]
MKKLILSILLLLTPIAHAAEPASALRSVRVTADVAANNSTATSLDLVFVYDKTAIATLPKSGAEWFEKKAALLGGLGRQIDVVSLQVPPGVVIEQVALPAQARRAVAVLCFVNFIDPAGQAVANLTRYRHAEIHLFESRVAYKDLPH